VTARSRAHALERVQGIFGSGTFFMGDPSPFQVSWSTPEPCQHGTARGGITTSLQQTRGQPRRAVAREVNSTLIDEFDRSTAATRNHEILSQLPVDAFWTTNFDSLIEDSIERAGRIANVRFTEEQLLNDRREGGTTVYKIHGDKSRPDRYLLAKDNFRAIQRDPRAVP